MTAHAPIEEAIAVVLMVRERALLQAVADLVEDRAEQLRRQIAAIPGHQRRKANLKRDLDKLLAEPLGVALRALAHALPA